MTNYPRIAWLLTSAFYYWQPMLKDLAEHFPQMIAFTAKWHGYAPNLENTFQVKVVGQRRIIPLVKDERGYGSNFTYLSPKIIQHLLDFQPDLIFSNSFGMWTLLALLLKPVGKWKVVIAYEGSSPSVDFHHSPLRLMLRRTMVSWADALISNSQAGKDYLIRTLNAPEDHVFAHPYEVPSPTALSLTSLGDSSLKAFGSKPTTAELLMNVPRPIFLFVGQLIPRKGVQSLLQSCQLLKHGGHDHFTLLVIGSGNQNPELQALSQSYGLADNVHWLGRVEYQQLGTYFHESDVFILPTLEDTWGVVVLEAMSLQKPILCSTKAGAAELVQDGTNGYRFDPQNPSELATLMAKLIDQPELIPPMGRQSLAMMQTYNPAAAAKFLADVSHFVLQE
jgi:glycosyltransferase involved in cell wall biosynthesis